MPLLRSREKGAGSRHLSRFVLLLAPFSLLLVLIG
jgi:hypothetical protein